MTGSERSLDVSVIIPTFNAGPRLAQTLDAILAETQGRTAEVFIVDDQSTDETLAIVGRYPTVTLVHGSGQGAAAAINQGIARAHSSLVAQIDQDVVVRPGWLSSLLHVLERNPTVAAVQGRYEHPHDANWISRVMSLDLATRYGRIDESNPNLATLDHVCTGNTLYRKAALERVQGFDESLGYGYDNDLSYRLRRHGYPLAHASAAKAVHHWRHSLWGYLRQQYGVGYGRLAVISRHPKKIAGDHVSRWDMIAHAVFMTLALLLLFVSILCGLLGGNSSISGMASLGIVTLLFTERLVAGIGAALRYRDLAGLMFPLLHLLRDLAWACAIAVWCVRRLQRSPEHAKHSMWRDPSS